MSEEKLLHPPFSVADSSPSKDGGAMLASPSNASVSSAASNSPSRDTLRKVLLKALHDEDDDDSADADAEVALKILLPLQCKPRSLKNTLYLESAEVITAFGAQNELRLALLKYARSQSHKRHADGEPAESSPPPKQIRKIVHHTDASRGAYVVHLTRDGVNPVETVKDAYPLIAKNTNTNVTEVWTIVRQRPAQVPPGDNPLLAFGEEQDTFPSPEVAEEFAAREKQRDDEVKRKEADENRNEERKENETKRRHEEETQTPAIQRPDLSKAEMMYALWPRGVPMNDETVALYDACRNAWISVIPRAEAYERHMLSRVKSS